MLGERINNIMKSVNEARELVMELSPMELAKEWLLMREKEESISDDNDSPSIAYNIFYGVILNDPAFIEQVTRSVFSLLCEESVGHPLFNWIHSLPYSEREEKRMKMPGLHGLVLVHSPLEGVTLYSLEFAEEMIADGCGANLFEGYGGELLLTDTRNSQLLKLSMSVDSREPESIMRTARAIDKALPDYIKLEFIWKEKER